MFRVEEDEDYRRRIKPVSCSCCTFSEVNNCTHLGWTCSHWCHLGWVRCVVVVVVYLFPSLAPDRFSTEGMVRVNDGRKGANKWWGVKEMQSGSKRNRKPRQVSPFPKQVHIVSTSWMWQTGITLSVFSWRPQESRQTLILCGGKKKHKYWTIFVWLHSYGNRNRRWFSRFPRDLFSLYITLVSISIHGNHWD